MEGATDPEVFRDRLYFKTGEIVYDNAKIVLAFSLILCISLTSLSFTLVPKYVEGYGEGELESIYGWDAVTEGFADENESSFEQFSILFNHPGKTVDDLEVISAMESTISILESIPEVDLDVPWETNEVNRSELVSETDSSWSRIHVVVNLNREESKNLLKDVIDDIVLPSDAPEGMQKFITGNLAIDVTFDLVLKEELLEAELIAAPLTLLILMFVFGSLIAALLPVFGGIYTVAAAAGIVTGLTFIFDDITVYAINIVSLLGIGLSVDYALFIVNRFREELGRGHDTKTALAMTNATAGRAILFSGLTVIAGLSGMLFFDNTGLPSLGWGGICATIVALISSVILLPSILALLGDKINMIKIPFGANTEIKDDGFWSWIAKNVMARPFAVLLPAVILLLAAGSPFLQAEWGITTYKALSPDNEARNGMELTDEKWPSDVGNTALIVFEIDEEVDPLAEQNIRDLYAYSKEILEIDGVNYVYSYSHFNITLSEDEVVAFWDRSGDDQLSQQDAMMVELQRSYHYDATIGDQVVLLIVGIEGEQSSERSREVVMDIRGVQNKSNQFGGPEEVNVAGLAAYNQDIVDAVNENLPIALVFILFSSYILIFLQVRSVIVPLKALVMNILSVCASFGLLVWIFQEGNGAELLNFTPQPIDPTTPVMIFAILFGLSMDYEVLMLSRIHEEWERTGDNTQSVAVGLQKSGRIITSAALVMITVFAAFGLSSISLMKQFGFMLALGVFVDATIVRALVVPSTMRLMGEISWWAPSWLKNDNPQNISDFPASIEAE